MTERQRRNAIAFLKRVPLKGEEAQALVELINLLAKGEKAETITE